MTEPPISEITRILTPWPAESRADDVLRVVRAMSEELKDAERALEMDERSIVPHHRNLIAEQLRSRLALAVAVIDALKRSTQFAECSGLVQALAAYDAVCASAAHPEREGPSKGTERLLLEVMLDIRDLLAQQREDVGRCPHGKIGICMACVIQGDLIRPHRQETGR